MRGMRPFASVSVGLLALSLLGAAPQPVTPADLDFLSGSRTHWVFHLGLLREATGASYYFGCFLGPDHSARVVLRKLTAGGEAVTVVEERFMPATVAREQGQLLFEARGQSDPAARWRLMMRAGEQQLMLTKGNVTLRLRSSSLGHPFWWHDRRQPPPGAQLMDKYYGVDDVAAMDGTLEVAGAPAVQLSGNGAFEAMYIDELRTLQVWQKEHWFFWTTPVAFGLVIDYDNYFDGYVAWRDGTNAWALERATVALSEPDPEKRPQRALISLHTPGGTIKLSGARIHQDLVYDRPIVVGPQELAHLHFVLTGQLVRPDGTIVTLGEGYGMDQTLVPIKAATVNNAQAHVIRKP